MRTYIVELLDHNRIVSDGLRTRINIERQLETADITLRRSRQRRTHTRYSGTGSIKTSEEEEGERTNQSGLRAQDQSLMTRLRCE